MKPKSKLLKMFLWQFILGNSVLGLFLISIANVPLFLSSDNITPGHLLVVISLPILMSIVIGYLLAKNYKKPFDYIEGYIDSFDPNAIPNFNKKNYQPKSPELKTIINKISNNPRLTITFSNKEKQQLRFISKFQLIGWGIGGGINFNAETDSYELVTFTIGINKRSVKQQEQLYEE